jgi:hypothetical protein
MNQWTDKVRRRKRSGKYVGQKGAEVREGYT